MSIVDGNLIQVGISPTATNNFVFQTNGAGGMTLKSALVYVLV